MNYSNINWNSIKNYKIKKENASFQSKNFEMKKVKTSWCKWKDKLVWGKDKLVRGYDQVDVKTLYMCVTTIFRPQGGPEISHLEWILYFKDLSFVDDNYYNIPKRSCKIIKCHHGCQKKNDNDAADLKACAGENIHGCQRSKTTFIFCTLI